MSFSAKYYNKPDGQDVSGKMLATNKYALLSGLGWSTIEVLMISKPQGYLPTLGRYIYFTVPFMGMASAFTMVTYTSTKMRGKDDKINYALGGLAAGGVFGAWKRSVVAGMVAGGILCIAAVAKKISKEEGWEFFPEHNSRGYGTVWGIRKNDYTLMGDRQKNWTSEPQK